MKKKNRTLSLCLWTVTSQTSEHVYIHSTHHPPPFPKYTRCSNALMATTHTSFILFIYFYFFWGDLRFLKLPNSSIPYVKNEQSDSFKFHFWCISLKNYIFYNSRCHFVMQQYIQTYRSFTRLLTEPT